MAPAGTMSLGQARVLTRSGVTVVPRSISAAATTTGTVSCSGPLAGFSKMRLMPTAAETPVTRARATINILRGLTNHLFCPNYGIKPRSRRPRQEGAQEERDQAEGHHGGKRDHPAAAVRPVDLRLH